MNTRRVVLWASLVATGLVLAVVVAIPFMVPLRIPTPEKECRSRLFLIDDTKELYAEEHGLIVGGRIVSNVVLTGTQLDTNYFRRGLTNLVCPEGGTYSVNLLDQPASCSVHGVPRRGTRR